MQPFESHRPATLDEVLAVLGRSSPSKVLAGAHDLFPDLPMERIGGSAVVPRGARAPVAVEHRAHLVRVRSERSDGDDERRPPAR